MKELLIVFHSKTGGARQMAEAAMRGASTENDVRVRLLHAAAAQAEDVLQAANWPNAREPVLVVGHQPTLGQVAAVLLSGQPQDWEMKKANAWWLVQRDPGDVFSLYLKAVMAPDLIVK